MESNKALSKQHSIRILKLTIFHRIFSYILLLVSSNFQRHFDTSSTLQLLTSLPTSSPILNLLAIPLLRWDGLHFLGIASPIPLPIPPSTSSERISIPPSFGYSSEHSLAFQSGLEWILRFDGYVSSYLNGDQKVEWNAIHSVLLASLLAGLLSLLSPLLLYHLTLKHTNSHRFSFLSSLISILSPSPSTLITPSQESFFSFFALLGFCFLAPSRSTRRDGASNAIFEATISGLSFGFATSFRANGILLAGFIWWKLGWEGSSFQKETLAGQTSKRFFRLLALPLLTLLVWTPFLSGQRWAYSRFCSDSSSSPRPWCDSSFPSVYTFAQDHYWNVGLFRYWELSQLPNFLLASPVLFLAGLSCWNFYSSNFGGILINTLLPLSQSNSSSKQSHSRDSNSTSDEDEKSETGTTTSPALTPSSTSLRNRNTPSTTQGSTKGTNSLLYLPRSPSSQEVLSFNSSPTLLPHIHFTLLSLLILVFASHTQIALRFSTPGGLPGVWWGAASLLLRESMDREKAGKRGLGWKSNVLIGWLVVWNVVSIVLTGGFYPPA